MARIRTVKPEFWDDQKIASVSFEARLTYIGIWNFCDDFGVTKANPIWLKSRIFPYDSSLSIEKFTGWLNELEKIGRLLSFEADGEVYYYLPKFIKHQVINRISKALRYPSPPAGLTEGSLSTHGALTEGSLSTHGGLTEGSLSTHGGLTVGREGKGKDMEGKGYKKLRTAPTRKNPEEIDLPSYVDRKTWADFCEMRRKIKKPLTDVAIPRMLKKLEGFHSRGHDVNEILNESITNSWQGVFEPKRSRFNNHRQEGVKRTMGIFARREYERQRQEANSRPDLSSTDSVLPS